MIEQCVCGHGLPWHEDDPDLICQYPRNKDEPRAKNLKKACTCQKFEQDFRYSEENYQMKRIATNRGPQSGKPTNSERYATCVMCKKPINAKEEDYMHSAKRKAFYHFPGCWR